MFDTVTLKCPKCGTECEIQSKAGSCLGGDYSPDNAPLVILMDIEGKRIHCPTSECGNSFSLIMPRTYKIE